MTGHDDDSDGRSLLHDHEDGEASAGDDNTHGFDGISRADSITGLPSSGKKLKMMLVLLFFLYVCEGVPFGLIGATLPIILKPALGFSRTGLFTICFYPSSLKLLWAPIVDSIWSPRLGRRRSWIIPALFLQGLVLLILALAGQDIVESLLAGGDALIVLLALCFALVLLSATAQCASDGWVVAELPEELQAAASATHEAGVMVGEFASGSALLLLRDAGYLSLAFFCGLISCLMLGLSLVLLFIPERAKPGHIPTGPREAYTSAFKLFLMPAVRSLITVHLLSRLGFEVDDTATNLRLLDKGFTTSGIAMMTTLDLPSDLLSSYAAAWLCKRHTPMRVWSAAFIGRLCTTVISMLLVGIAPNENAMSTTQLVLNSTNRVLSISLRTIMIVAIITFHLQIVDASIGSVYMTLLATALNLGRFLPQALIMHFIDVFTFRTCSPSGAPCAVSIDGYLVVGVSCVAFGSLLFFSFLREEVLRLQALPKSAWMLE